MEKTELKKAVKIADKLKALKQFNLFYEMYPEKGPRRKELYSKHWEYFAAGLTFYERAALGGNQSGKTTLGAYEFTCHLTGEYPKDWPGHKFKGPITGAVYSVTKGQTRVGAGEKLLGKPENPGTGMIPKHLIHKVVRVQGSGGFVDYVIVKHKSGGLSYCHFYTKDQGRENIQGQSLDLVWMDEEPPEDMYGEIVVRTAAAEERGSEPRIMLTFTPLNGLSSVALKFLPDGIIPIKCTNRFVMLLDWADAPHLSEKSKARMRETIPPHELAAREHGLPIAGSGMIYPFEDKAISCAPFLIPEDWPRMYGFDYSKKRTVAVFAAKDPISGRIYIYDLYVGEHADPVHTANAIRQRAGDWMIGVSEGKNSNWMPGKGKPSKYVDVWRQEYGLNLREADQSKGSVKLGIDIVTNKLSNGTLIIFASLKDWFYEKNLYHWDEKPGPDGKRVVHKDLDDAMDATRYIIYNGDRLFRQNPDTIEPPMFTDKNYSNLNPVTGY